MQGREYLFETPFESRLFISYVPIPNSSVSGAFIDTDSYMTRDWHLQKHYVWSVHKCFNKSDALQNALFASLSLEQHTQKYNKKVYFPVAELRV